MYVLDLHTRPRVLDLRAALDAPQWCGTQCVSLCGDCVAVGTHMDGVHVLDWRTGWRGAVQRTDRVSTAAVRLTPEQVVVVTRLGALRVFERPRDEAPGALVAQHELTDGRPLLGVALGHAHARELQVLVLDESSLLELVLPPAGAPVVRAQLQMPPERITGLAAGSSAHNAVVLSSGGGVPPRCCVRAFTAGGGMWPLRPAPVVAAPEEMAHETRYIPSWPRRRGSASSTESRDGAQSDGYSAGSLSVAMSPSTSQASLLSTQSLSSSGSAPQSPRPPRIDSFAADAPPPPVRTLPSTRADMLTEAALDECHGLLCLASARGAVWIADYGGTTM